MTHTHTYCNCTCTINALMIITWLRLRTYVVYVTTWPQAGGSAEEGREREREKASKNGYTPNSVYSNQLQR